MEKVYLLILILISASSTGCLIDNDSDAKIKMLIATEDATGDWEIQLVGWKYNNSVNDVGWRLSDTQGNSIISGTVSGIYGYYQGDGKPVIFIDNDFNGKLSIGDKFGIYPGEDASIDDVTDYTFALEELTTAEWVVSVKLEGYDSSSIWILEEAETGEMYSLKQYYDDNVTMVEFFHSDCSHCYQQTEPLKEIYYNYSTEIYMFSIGGYKLGSNTDGKRDIADFKFKYSLNWPHLYDSSGELMREYGFNSYPSMVLIKNDKIVYSHSGQLTYEQLSNEIDKHL